MHGGTASSGELTWREIVAHHQSLMADELSVRLDSDLREAVSDALNAERARAEKDLSAACDQARRSQSEALNQSLRRLRQASGEKNILQTLSESCAAHTSSTVVLVFENNQAHVAACSGLDAAGLSFDLAAAPAVVSAIESRDPVVALVAETELAPELVRRFETASNASTGHNAYLFPLIARHSVVSMLIASGPAPFNSAPIELLCEAAGMRLETLMPRGESVKAEPAKESELVQLAPCAPAAMPPEEQKLHLQAQRMARVRVAEMRLYNERELREGIAAGNLYDSLQSAIDSARSQFLKSFMAKSSTMVDYIHNEILNSLAHGDAALLGKNYPGPMA